MINNFNQNYTKRMKKIVLALALVFSTATISTTEAAIPVKKNTIELTSTVSAKTNAEMVNMENIQDVEEMANQLEKDAETSMYGGSKSWTTALILAIFLGMFSVHRFYLGYTWQGIVQILSVLAFGIGGIWVLIDLIRIIIRDLQPKNGSYRD
jgi:TM2 domain-containing membrane protein YozV